MSAKKHTGKSTKKNRRKNAAAPQASLAIPEYIVQALLAVMLGIFPLYYQNKYYNMGDAKYLFFRTATLTLLTVLALFLAFDQLITSPEDRRRPKFSFLDAAVLVYTAAAVLSWIFSPFRAEAWIGSHEWYMGLLSQQLFAGIYFAVSRFCSRRKWALWIMGASAALVFLIAYLHRFKIDPLGLYENISDYYQVLFLGTIGQATWYSSYIAVVLPVLMGIYLVGQQTDVKNPAERGDGLFSWIFRNGKLAHMLTGCLIFLGFCSAVTQNSDSIYVGLGLAFVLFLWFAMTDPHMWKRYMELCLIALSAAKVTGLLQTAFPERVPELDTLSLAVTKGKAGWPILAAAAVIYAVTLYLLHRRKQETAAESPHTNQTASGCKGQIFSCTFFRRFRNLLFAGLGACLLFLPIAMWMVSTGRISGGSGPLGSTGYLNFDGDGWGSGRGKTWSYCIRIFSEYPPLMKLFGCGPDSLTFYSEAHHAAEIQAMWNGLSLTNAHNEWLTALINYGFIGAAAYLSIFVLTAVRALSHWKESPILLAAAAAILSYAGHNFFCYQQAVCTPLIFIVIGAAEYLCRNPEEAKL